MSPSRLAPLSGPLGIGGIILGLVMDTLPDGNVTDAELKRYLAENGYGKWLFMAIAIGIGGALLLVFAGVLADRAERAAPGSIAAQVVRTAGTAWGVLTLVGAASWASIPVAHLFSTDRDPTASYYAFGFGMAYGTLVMFCAFAAATTATALTTIALRTDILPRWLAIAGVPASVLILANAVMPMAVITLYFVAVGICLARRPVTARASGAVPAMAG